MNVSPSLLSRFFRKDSKNKNPFVRFFTKHSMLFVFIVYYAVFAFLTAKDFGVAWDELEIYSRSKFLYNYLIGKATFAEYLSDPYGLYYNHIVPMISVVFNPHETYGIFHLLGMIFALPMYIASYILLFKRFNNTFYAVLGPIIIFLIPSLTGHLPINPKDIPFAVLYFLSITAIYLFGITKKFNLTLKIIILGILFGLAQSVRILGFTLPVVYVLYELYILGRKNRRWEILGQILLNVVLICIISNFLLAVTWPYLGVNYFYRLRELFTVASKFHWLGEVLFMGSFVPSTELPLYYLPVWFAVTTPLFISVFFLKPLTHLKTVLKDSLLGLLFGVLLLNAAMFVLIKPIVYDGHRHYLFLYPIIGTIAAISFVEFLKSSSKYKTIVTIFVLLNIVKVVIEMALLHPYQYMYFNETIGGLPGAYGKFETEYMGTSHKEGILWLREHVPDKTKDYMVRNCGHHFSGMYYLRDKFHWTDTIENADYYVCYTRGNDHLAVPQEKTIHVIRRLGVPINYIMKL